jgi:hypothetical protein
MDQAWRLGFLLVYPLAAFPMWNKLGIPDCQTKPRN